MVNIKAIGKYTKLRDKILIRHIKCGYEWEPRADSILNTVALDVQSVLIIKPDSNMVVIVRLLKLG